jgi:hypothetical protein
MTSLAKNWGSYHPKGDDVNIFMPAAITDVEIRLEEPHIERLERRSRNHVERASPKNQATGK